MNDKAIVALYFSRSEQAIDETKKKYGGYLHTVANGILRCDADADECESDVYLGAWNSIPPHRPADLRTYLSKLARRAALDRFRLRTAQKRGGETDVSLSELDDCLPSGQNVGERVEAKELSETVRAFLRSLPAKKRRVFLRRYFYFDTAAEIAARYQMSEGAVRTMLSRLRDDLRAKLNEEGFFDET